MPVRGGILAVVPFARPSRAGRAVAALGAAVSILLATAGCGLFTDTGPQDVATAFLAAWTAGDNRGAAALTDDPGPAAELLTSTRDALAPEALEARLGQVRTATDQATASVDVTWRLGPERVWSYLGELELRPAPDTEEGWRVHWAATVVHPELAAGQRPAPEKRRPTADDTAPAPPWEG